ncbi:MAG: hypothetical protein VX328_02675 [Candidatus Thermoplasmatota archaeon]|nr:hypothetical protein [Candidatus Thermoplasmatota archaeon]
MKHSEDNNRDATLGGDEGRSNFITINNLRIRARLARDGSNGEGTPNGGSPFSPHEGGWGIQIPPQQADWWFPRVQTPT